MTVTVETKQCNKCKLHLPLDSFQMDKTKKRKDGTYIIRGNCRKCTNEYRKNLRRAKNTVTRIESNVAVPVTDDTRMSEKEKRRRMRAVEGMGY